MLIIKALQISKMEKREAAIASIGSPLDVDSDNESVMGLPDSGSPGSPSRQSGWGIVESSRLRQGNENPYTGPAIMHQKGPADELSILRRRLELYREEIERLKDALKSARGEAGNEESDAYPYIASLKREAEALRAYLKARESALEQSAQARQRVEGELENRNSEVTRLQNELRQKQHQLEATSGIVEDLERERQVLREQLLELTASRAPGGDQEEPVEAVASEGPASAQGPRHLVRGLSLLAVLLIAIPVISVLWNPGSYRSSHLLQDPVGGEIPDIQGQIVRPSAEDAPDPSDTPERTRGAVVARGEGAQVAESTRVSAATPKEVLDRLRLGMFGPKLAVIDPGRFEMGARPGLATDDAFPVREIQVDRFLIGVNEVTYNEYDTFARATGRRLPRDFGWGRRNRPVVDVSWWDAQAYVDWLSSQTGKGYRLPSEAEWEYAARAGTSSMYWWGSTLERPQAVCFDCGSPWDNRSTAPIGTFAANPFGLYDTAGNAMEWVADCYHPNYEMAPMNGRAWQSGPDCAFRVARGGAFNKPARSMRSAARHRYDPSVALNMLGFRVARDPED